MDHVLNRLPCCIACLLAFFLLPETLFAAPSKGLNVLILYADDMGFGDLEIQNLDSSRLSNAFANKATRRRDWRAGSPLNAAP